jgi:hypothetical protein
VDEAAAVRGTIGKLVVDHLIVAETELEAATVGMADDVDTVRRLGLARGKRKRIGQETGQ